MKFEFNKDKNTGIIITILFHSGLLVIFMLMSLKPPYPPLPQIGVEVNLGNSEDGMGDVQPEELAASKASMPQPSASNNQKLATQSTEESMNLSQKQKAQSNQVPSEVKTEQTADKRFIYNANKANKGGSQGDGKNPGDKGNPNGDPNAKNYVGDGGKGNIGFNLAGRKARSLPAPSYDVNEQGTVVMRIWVDKNGRVTSAEPNPKGSTTTNARLQSLAYQAAMKAQFDVKADAPDLQMGSITYVFQILR